MPSGRSPLATALAWTVAALALATIVQARHVSSIGSLEGALRVGVDTPARGSIESELGAIPLTDGLGHDGYWYYLSARDPFALDDERTDTYLAYRHRRLAGPLIAGLGGAAPPRTALVGLNVLGILGFGLAAGSASWIATRRGARPWAPLGVLLSIGLWLSVQLLTADTLTVGLALLAVALALEDRWRWVAIVGVVAVLAKETTLLFTLGLAAWAWWEGRRREAMFTAAAPLVALAVWLTYLQLVLGEALASNDNLTLPFAGIIEALPGLDPGADRVYGWLALAGVGLAIAGVAAGKDRLITSLAVPWIVMALVSSPMVWDNGNNAVRVLAPCFVLGMLGVARALSPDPHVQASASSSAAA